MNNANKVTLAHSKCSYCKEPLEGHKRCKRCKILLHEAKRKYISHSGVQYTLEGQNGFCADCELLIKS